jgi:hypothetical protein
LPWSARRKKNYDVSTRPMLDGTVLKLQEGGEKHRKGATCAKRTMENND